MSKRETAHLPLAVIPILEIAKLNSRLFLNCLDSMSDELANQRPNEHTNNVIFIACHVYEARRYLANSVGGRVENPFADYELTTDTGVKRVDEVNAFPPVEHLRSAWTNLADVLHEQLAQLTEETLRQPSDAPYPVDVRTALGDAAFLLEHESYHIGQMSLLRKYLGLPAMAYA